MNEKQKLKQKEACLKYEKFIKNKIKQQNKKYEINHNSNTVMKSIDKSQKETTSIVKKDLSYEDIMNSENILEALMERILIERNTMMCPFCRLEIMDYKKHMKKKNYNLNHILNKYEIQSYNTIIKKYVNKEIFFNLCNTRPITAHDGQRMVSSKYLNYLISNLFSNVKEK